MIRDTSLAPVATPSMYQSSLRTRAMRLFARVASHGVLLIGAAIFAMIPLTRQVFWGPMAVAIMGGLIVATVLTCLFLPALYAAWFRVREPDATAVEA